MRVELEIAMQGGDVPTSPVSLGPMPLRLAITRALPMMHVWSCVNAGRKKEDERSSGAP